MEELVLKQDLPHINCHTDATRIKLYKSYYIYPIIYTRLLNGETLHSDANSEIKDKYYKFLLKKNKSDESPCNQIVCGMGAAGHFTSLGVESLPFFNPLKSLITDNNNVANTYHTSNNDTKTWDPVAKQLWNAINLIILKCHKYYYGGPLFAIRYKLLQKPAQEPSSGLIKSINTIMDRLDKGKTLTQYVNECKINDPNFQDFKFDLLVKKLDIDTRSHF